MSQLPEPTASPGPDALPADAAPSRRGPARWVITSVGALVVVGVTVGAMRLGDVVAGPSIDQPVAGAAAHSGELAAADPPSAATAFTPRPPAKAPLAFHPVVRFARFGGLPVGMVPRTTVVQAREQGGYTIEAGLPDRSTGAQVAVTFFPSGVTPHRDCLAAANLVHIRTASATVAAAPAVRGKPAQLIGGRLRWEYAPGGWAEAIGKDLLAGAGEDPVKNLPALVEIAEDLRYGWESLRFPLAVGGIPQRMHLAVASVTERSKVGWSSGLVFTSRPYCGGEKAAPKDALAVRVEAIIPGYGWTGDHSNTTVDGHRAVKQESPTGQTTLAVYDDPGPYVVMTTSDAATTSLFGGDGLVGFYRRVRVLGATSLTTIAEPADQSGWTTDPVR